MMKKIIEIFLLCIVSIKSSIAQNSNQPYVAAEVLTNVVQLVVNDQLGTGFFLSHNDRFYLVTAKHLLENRNEKPSVQIIGGFGKLEKVNYKNIIIPRNGTVDIIAFETVEIRNLMLKPLASGHYLSKEIFLAGFPSVRLNNKDKFLVYEKYPNFKTPIPIIRRGIISSLSNGKDVPFILDIHNMKGYSGSPVIIDNQVLAVVSAYLHDDQPDIYIKNQKGEYEKNDSIRIDLNSELTIAYDIKNILEILDGK